jgi:hypothetical protein
MRSKPHRPTLSASRCISAWPAAEVNHKGWITRGSVATSSLKSSRSTTIATAIIDELSGFSDAGALLPTTIANETRYARLDPARRS